MNPDRWQQINNLFQAAVELPPERRTAFLDQACTDDQTLRSEVESLLASDEQEWDFIEKPASELAAKLLADDHLQLAPGQHIGHYTIISLIGRGGMGEVYGAEDSRLGRKVAIKVLPAALSADVDRLRRFEQEARAASTLNHPNVTVIYDVGEQDGLSYIVSEFLEGETLREWLIGKTLTTRKTIEYALQIARGLAAAHDRGIVHRDLKPENIFITKEGRAKILDFGLAKLVEPPFRNDEQSKAVTVRESDTAPGLLMGTAGYMSPEQVRGRAVDHRSDIFSFGSILYEMLTGNRAFRGESSIETMNAILKENLPELSETNLNINPALSRVLGRCLEKNPEERFHSANDLAFALEVLVGSTGMSGQTIAPLLPVKRKTRERIIWLVVVGILCLSLALLYFFRPQTKGYLARFSVPLPEKTSRISSLSISPDGRVVAIVGTTEGKTLIWLRSIDSLSLQPLAGTDGALNLFWSPDSRYLAFFADGKLKKVEARGGPPETLCDAPYGRGGAWNRDGTIVFSPQAFTGLYRVSASGGVPTQITALDQSTGENSHRWPHFLPDGRHFVFFVRSEKAGQTGICVASLDSSTRTFLISSGSGATYSDGYLLFLREKTLIAQRFDNARLQITGEPFPIAEEVGSARNLNEQQGYFSVSENGVLAYSQGSKDDRRYAWFDRAGKELSSLALTGDVRDMALSPDGKRAAVQFTDSKNSSANEDIWLIDLERNVASRFTYSSAAEDFPVWSPDSTRVVFNSLRGGEADIYQCLYNTAGKEDLLLKSETNKNPTDWSSDGRFLLYENINSNAKIDLWVLPLFGDRKPFPYLVTDFNASQGHWSPDGRWIAYVSDESGRDEIYVQNFPAGGDKLLISNGGGRQPIWRRDGKELFYFAPNGKLMSVEIKAGARLEASAPRLLFESRVDNSAASNRYAVSGDGKRLLINSPTEEAAPKPITVVLDWNMVLNSGH